MLSKAGKKNNNKTVGATISSFNISIIYHSQKKKNQALQVD